MRRSAGLTRGIWWGSPHECVHGIRWTAQPARPEGLLTKAPICVTARIKNHSGTSTDAVAHRLKRFQKLHQLPALLLRQRRQHLAVQLRRASRGVFVARVGVAPAQSAEAKTLITIAAKTDLDRIKLAAAHHKLVRSVLAIFGVVRAFRGEQ